MIAINDKCVGSLKGRLIEKEEIYNRVYKNSIILSYILRTLIKEWQFY